MGSSWGPQPGLHCHVPRWQASFRPEQMCWFKDWRHGERCVLINCCIEISHERGISLLVLLCLEEELSQMNAVTLNLTWTYGFNLAVGKIIIVSTSRAAPSWDLKVRRSDMPAVCLEIRGEWFERIENGCMLFVGLYLILEVIPPTLKLWRIAKGFYLA